MSQSNYFNQLTDIADHVMSVEFDLLQEEPKLHVLLFLAYFYYALNYYELLTEDGRKLFYQAKGSHEVILFLQNVQTHFRLRVQIDKHDISQVKNILIDNLWSDYNKRKLTYLAEEDIIKRQNKREDWEFIFNTSDWLTCLFLHRMSTKSKRYWDVLKEYSLDVVKPELPKRIEDD